MLSAQVISSTNITDIIFSTELEDLANFTAQNSENTAQIVIPASIVSQIAAVNNITGRLVRSFMSVSVTLCISNTAIIMYAHFICVNGLLQIASVRR